MKQIINTVGLLVLVMITGIASAAAQTSISGSWTKTDATTITTWLFQDGHYSCTQYDISNKRFDWTLGGDYTVSGDQLNTKLFFHTANKEKVGTDEVMKFAISNQSLVITKEGSSQTFTRMDDGKAALAGHWFITGRVVNGNMQTITPGARRTIKLLTGSRFQWIAINVETKEFFGTGGGTYTFVNGKYTETIEFFSRDSSRVGASLSFDGKVEGNNWHHSGLSSRGEPIHEIWTRN